MIGPRVRLIGRFLLLFVVVLAVLVPVWTAIAPTYNAMVTELARPVFRGVENPNRTVLSLQEGEIWVLRIVDDTHVSPFTVFDRYAFFALVPMISLLIATPRMGLRRRLACLSVGLLAILLFQLMYLVVSVELSYAALGLMEVGIVLSAMLDGLQVLVRVLWEAAPILIWVVLTAPIWRRSWQESQGPRTMEARRLMPDGPATKAEG